MDPILECLIERNKTLTIEYSDRLIIPVGGLQKMLDEFKGYHLNRVEVIKSELTRQEVKSTQKSEPTLEELYQLLD